jgi:hypothetical protein
LRVMQVRYQLRQRPVEVQRTIDVVSVEGPAGAGRALTG